MEFFHILEDKFKECNTPFELEQTYKGILEGFEEMLLIMYENRKVEINLSVEDKEL